MFPLRLFCLKSVSEQVLANLRIKTFVPRRNLDAQYKSVQRNYSLTTDVSKTELLKAKSSPEKDKLLYYYENPRFYLLLNGFAFVQFFFWVHMSEFTFKKMRDVDIYKGIDKEKIFWWQKLNFKDDTIRGAVSAFCFFMGYSVLAVCWLYTLRSVRMLVLRKGGKTVSIVTYGPFNRNRTLDVSLEKMSTDVTRDTAKSLLPIKVQGKWFYYLLDTKNGTFHNPELFDFTAGMKRVLNK